MIAKVNDYIIKKEEFGMQLQHLMQSMQVETADHDTKQKALDKLIDAYLLLEAARQANIEIEVADLDNQEIEYMMCFADKESFQTMLAANNTSQEKIRVHLHDTLLIKKYIQISCACQKEIPADKLLELYEDNKSEFIAEEQVRVSHILIANDDEDAQTTATEIRKLINNPQEFKAITEVVSTCPSNTKSGDLGYISRGKMVAAFDATAFALGKDEISAPVKTAFGYHIIMVTDKLPRRTVDFATIKPVLYKRLMQIEVELALIKHLKELRAAANIHVNEEGLATFIV